MKRPRRLARPAFVLTTPMGLDGVAADELREVAPESALQNRTSTELVITDVADPSALTRMRSISDAWVHVRTVKGIGPDRRSLEALKGVLMHTTLPPILGIERSGINARRPVGFLLTATMREERAYGRPELLRSVEDGLRAHRTLRLRPSAGKADLRLWLHLEGTEARLVAAMQQRPVGVREREASLPGALPGPVAYAMARLTRPRPADAFADLTCGTGSIALERAENWRHAMLLAGDVDALQLAAAIINFGPRHKPRLLTRWDATRLPLVDNSLDAAACNPPHGQQMMPDQDLEPLYRGITREAKRTLHIGSALTFLTPRRQMMDRVVSSTGGFRIERCFVIDLLGRRPYLYLLRRI